MDFCSSLSLQCYGLAVVNTDFITLGDRLSLDPR